MTKIKFGAIVVDGRNKIGGHVLSKNRAGNYMRTKVTPVNPQTIAQTMQRNNFATLSQNWRGLTEAQRLSWASQVTSFQRTDIFGDLKSPTPLQLYMRINGNLQLAGAPLLSTAPVPGDTPQISELTVAADVSDQSLEVDTGDGAVPADTAYLIEATPSISAGANYVGNKWRVLSVADAATVLPVDVGTEYTDKFGAIALGQKFFVRVTPISTVNGLRGLPIAEQAVISA